MVYPDVDGPGAATFSHLPDGGYVLVLNDYHLLTDEDRIDLGIAGLGRASATLTDGGDTFVELDAKACSPGSPTPTCCS